MMTQWLPVWQMPRSAVEKAVSTFVHVFPHAVLFVGCDDEFILLGSPAPLDFTVLERRFGISASVTADLRQWGIREPADLLARVVQTDKMLRRHYGSFRTISDRRNDFAYLFRPPEGEVVISYNPAAVIVGLEVERLTCGARLQGMLMDLGRLREAVPDFPIASLMSVRNSGVAGVARADVDWRQVARLERIASGAAAAGQPSQAMTAYRAALRLAGEQSGVLAGLASLEMQTGQFERAMETWLRYGRLRPRDGQAECSIGMCLNSLGRYDEAVPHLLAAIELTPQWSAPHGLLGDAFLHQNRYHDALRAYERSSELDPSNEILVRKIQAVRAQLSN
jgi:tetratricopeptide (TPR) repeat protein